MLNTTTNPRYLAYCYNQGNTPEEQKAIDVNTCEFQCFIRHHIAEFRVSVGLSKHEPLDDAHDELFDQYLFDIPRTDQGHAAPVR